MTTVSGARHISNDSLVTSLKPLAHYKEFDGQTLKNLWKFYSLASWPLDISSTNWLLHSLEKCINSLPSYPQKEHFWDLAKTRGILSLRKSEWSSELSWVPMSVYYITWHSASFCAHSTPLVQLNLLLCTCCVNVVYLLYNKLHNRSTTNWTVEVWA